MDVESILLAKKAWSEGQNITAALRESQGTAQNTSEIIEIAYEMQSGTYTDYAKANEQALDKFTSEYSSLLEQFLEPRDCLLDIGSGELTTLSLVLSKLGKLPANIIATDISWSRLSEGSKFYRRFFDPIIHPISLVSCEMLALPFQTKSVDVTISNHALEPNGRDIRAIISELFRVTSRKLVLYEPYFEGSNRSVRRRMKQLGYFRGIERVVAELGGTVEQITPLRRSLSELNPTHCMVISPPVCGVKNHLKAEVRKSEYSIPGTDYSLEYFDGFYHSQSIGLSFPVLRDIPILRLKNSIFSLSLTSQVPKS